MVAKGIASSPCSSLIVRVDLQVTSEYTLIEQSGFKHMHEFFT